MQIFPPDSNKNHYHHFFPRILLFISFISSLSFSEVIELKFATLAPQSSTWGKALSLARREIFLKTDRKVKIIIYWSAQMGDEAEMISKMRVGQIDGAAFTGNGLGLLLKESRVLELPFLFKNKTEVDLVYKNITPKLREYFSEKNIYLSSLAETGEAYFFSKNPIYSFEDIAKDKLWLWKGDEFAKSLFDQLNIPTIPIAFSEVVPSLQTGLINSFYATPTASIALQWNNYAKYFLNMPITTVSGGIFFNQGSWDKLPKEYQEVIDEVIQEQIMSLTILNRANDIKSLDIFSNSPNITVLPFKGTLPNETELQKKILSDLKKKSGVNSKYVNELYKIINSTLK